MIEPIDLTKLIPSELAAYPAIVQAIIPDIVEATRTEIIRLAGERLNTSQDIYIQGVQPAAYHFPSGRVPDGESTVATIELVGIMPNMIEQGWEGGDMKAALLAGRSGRDTKSGRMAIIPFRHGAPGGSNRNFQKMGTAHVRTSGMAAEIGRRIGRSIHRAAKALEPGQRLGPGHSPKLRPHHTTDIHHGMVKQIKTYKKSVQAQYKTFRAVSQRSTGWIHPGIEAHHLFEEGAAYAGKITGHLLQAAMRGAEKGAKQ